MDDIKKITKDDKLNLYEFDLGYDVDYLCGVDEAGRGPLAGSCFAAAVILPKNCYIEGLNDSKKLSEKKRELLFDIIIQKAIYYSIQSSSVEEIEQYNILNAALLAMKKAIENIPIKPDLVIVDGNKKPVLTDDTIKVKSIIKGDGTSQSIAAASILAKVSRDRYMLQMNEIYPEYEFNKHKGYGTKLHYEKITQYGTTKIHRPSFLKKFYQKEQVINKDKIKLGRYGEDKTIEYLLKKGYEILFKNYYTNQGEIDIIAKKDDIIYIVEVKTRKNFYPLPQESIGSKKRTNIKNSTEIFIQNEHIDLPCVFSISEIVIENNKCYINYIKDAFDKA